MASLAEKTKDTNTFRVSVPRSLELFGDQPPYTFFTRSSNLSEIG